MGANSRKMPGSGLICRGRGQGVVIRQIRDLRLGVRLAEGLEYPVRDQQCLVTVTQPGAFRATAPGTAVVTPVEVTASGGAERPRQGDRIVGHNLHSRVGVNQYRFHSRTRWPFSFMRKSLGARSKYSRGSSSCMACNSFVFDGQIQPPASGEELRPGLDWM